MEMFIGGSNNVEPCNLGEVAKMSKHVIRNADSREIDFYFFELLEKPYDELLDLYNDYKNLHKQFSDIVYKININIIMEVLKTKGEREVIRNGK